MALDGVITATERTADGVRITLGPRPAHQYMAQGGEVAYSPASEPGQPQLLIIGASFEPVVGDEVWGGAGFAEIISGGVHFPYQREGYTTLYEDWLKESLS